MATKYVGGPGGGEQPARTSARPGLTTRERVSVKAHTRARKGGAPSTKFRARVSKNTVSIETVPGQKTLRNQDAAKRGTPA